MINQVVKICSLSEKIQLNMFDKTLLLILFLCYKVVLLISLETVTLCNFI